ncbi:class I SAM-dependent methyltransferase [Ectothiorhodospira shaposhnikovii]|uniref:class I SAM-dependent methyltransferase n=1 Tax=Ectothiorhodospira shaposhnikovii TaxID=1054 RepID=UPI0039A168A8
MKKQKQNSASKMVVASETSNQLTQARTYWLFGEWQRLASIPEETIQDRPERATIALLISNAHQQLGDLESTRHWAQLAMQWGLKPTQVARLLAAGVHHTLGRIAILRENAEDIGKHFTASMQLAQMQDTESGTLAKARAVQEAGALHQTLPPHFFKDHQTEYHPAAQDNFYRVFEDRFRGSRELIKQRVLVYLPFVQPIAKRYPGVSVLDLGCGRGEWLEVLKETGIPAEGVDQDAGMLEAAQLEGLSIQQGDALAYLLQQRESSRICISLMHVVEHIPFEMLRAIVKEARRVLVPQGILIMETPNPENYTVGSCNFYMDPTHRNPLPPPLLAFVPEYYGFERVKVLRLQEPDGMRTRDEFKVEDFLTGISPDYAVLAQVNRFDPSEEEGRDPLANPWDQEYGVSYTLMSKRNAQTSPS